MDQKDCAVNQEDKITPSAQQAAPIGSRQKREITNFPPIGGIEGMVPPRPILHQVCNGFKKADIPNIVIVYSGQCETSEQWCAYLKRILNINSDEPCGIHSQPIEDLSTGLGHRKDNRVCEEKIYHAKFQVFIISPAFLDWVERWNLDIGRLARPGKLVGLMLGVIDVDLKPIHLQFISNYVEWKVLDLKNEGENEEVTVQVSKLSQELVQKEKLVPSSSESSFRIFPRKINSGQNKLLLLLESAFLPSQELEVSLAFEGLHLIIEDYKILKPDCLQIEIPDSAMVTSCMASLEVFVDRRSLGETKLKLESNFSLFQSVWNNQIQPHKLLSEAYGMKFRSAGELDLYLARTLTARMAAQYSSINTLKPSETDRINTNSEEDFLTNNQTLLHWAAHNGFRDLASTLLSLGWTIHLNTQDSDKMLPHEIAERAGHTTLATFLRSYRTRMNQPESKLEESEQSQTISSTDKNEKTGLDGYLIPNNIIDNTVHSVQQQTNNNNSISRNTDNGMIFNNGLQSFILTRRVDQNGNIQLAATSQEYMGNNYIQKLQETRNPSDINIMDLTKQKHELDSNYDIPRSLAVPFYNNINPSTIQDEDITTPTSDPFYLVPPAPRPYSNPPPTPDIGEVMTAVNVSLNKTPQLDDGESKDKIEIELDFENFNEVSLHDADTRPASPCFNAGTRPASPCFNSGTQPAATCFIDSVGDWKPPLPVIKPCISSPAAINSSTCQLQSLATCQKPANYINLQPDSSCQTNLATPQTSLATPQTSLSKPQTSLVTMQTSLCTPQTCVATPQTSVAMPQTSVAMPQTSFTSPQTKCVCQQDTCQQPTLRHESPMFKSPLLPPRLRHHSNQERTNTPKIIPDSFRRSSTPVLRSSWSEASPSVGEKGDSEQNTQRKKAAYIKMSRKIPPPLGAFPIPKSGSFGSSQDRRFSSQESTHLYQNIKYKEIIEAAESIQKKPESRKDIIAKLIQDNPTKIGTLPSIPSEGAINQDTSEDKEVCGYLNNKITEDLTPISTAKVKHVCCKGGNFFLEALKNQDLDCDDGREFRSIQTTDAPAIKKEDDENMSATPKNDSTDDSETDRDISVKATSSVKVESPSFPSQLKTFEVRSRNDSGDQDKGKIKKLLGRLSPANFGRRSSRSKKGVEVTESPFKPIHFTDSVEKEKQIHFQEIKEESKEKDDLQDFKKKTVTKNPGEMNMRRRTCSPCQIFKASAPTPPPKLVKATTLPVSDMLTDYDIPRSLTNSRENLFANVTCQNQPLTDEGKATFKVVETSQGRSGRSTPTNASSTSKTSERRIPSRSSTPRSSLTGVSAAGVHLPGSSTSRSSLTGSCTAGASLTGSSAAGVHLTGSSTPRSSLTGISTPRSSLSGISTPRPSLTESRLPRLPPTGRTPIVIASGSGNRTANRDVTLDNNINKNIGVTESSNNSNTNLMTDATGVNNAPKDTKDIESNEEKSWEVTIPISIATE